MQMYTYILNFQHQNLHVAGGRINEWLTGQGMLSALLFLFLMVYHISSVIRRSFFLPK